LASAAPNVFAHGAIKGIGNFGSGFVHPLVEPAGFPSRMPRHRHEPQEPDALDSARRRTIESSRLCCLLGT
jgi:hypothetical protein